MKKMQVKSKRKILFSGLSFIMLLSVAVAIGSTVRSVNASAQETGTPNETVYTNNTPFPKDYMHKIYYKNETKKYMNKNVTGWIKKDPVNNITITYSNSVSGSISYSIESTTQVTAAITAAIQASQGLNQSLTFSYTATEMKSFTWVVSPQESGNYFCIGVNYQAKKSVIDHYHQKFVLFGQGPYQYECSSTVWTPSEKYLAKNYKYDINGTTYER